MELRGSQYGTDLAQTDVVRGQPRVRGILVEGELEVPQERIKGEDREDENRRKQQ